jgi:thiamine pyrophosphate-dependent acetolactate synthase large subunit-like protein
MLGYRVIAEALAAVGVETVFGVLGDGNFHFVDAWVHETGGRYVSARHEGGAVNMADGAARMAGRDGFGVATVTHGPGLTNTVTALTAAVRNRTPLLLIAGDLPQAATRHNQRIDQAAVVAPTGAGYVRVTTPAGAAAQVTLALRQALLERRPVVLDVANDVQRADWPAPADGARLREAVASARAQRVAPDPAAVAEAAAALAGAHRPVLLAGRGAVWSGAGEALRRLAERSGALLATTMMGSGLFRGDPFDIGLGGVLSGPTTTRLFGEADHVVAFGTGLHSWTTNLGRLFPGATLTQVDADPARVADFVVPDRVLVADALLAAEALADAVPPRTDEGFRTGGVRAAIAAISPYDGLEESAAEGRIDTRVALITLDEVLPPERMVLSDGGHYFGYPAMYLGVPEPDAFALAANFGSIGLGLGTAIGAAVARPDRLALLIVGDGGLLMSLPELESAVRHRVRLVVAVVNDAAYGAEVHSMRANGLPVDTAQFPETDFVRLAEGLGARGVAVRSVAELKAVGELLPGLQGPLVVDLKVDPDLVAPWYLAAKPASPAVPPRSA